jgi:hypothetical protein
MVWYNKIIDGILVKNDSIIININSTITTEYNKFIVK